MQADAAVSWGPGLRWGVMGPSLLWHIGGGEGGIHHFMETLMDPMTILMKDLGNPEVTTELKQTIIRGVMQEAGNSSVEQLAQEENETLIRLLSLRAKGATDFRVNQIGCSGLVSSDSNTYTILFEVCYVKTYYRPYYQPNNRLTNVASPVMR